MLRWVLLVFGGAAVGSAGRISGKTVHPLSGGGFCHRPATKPTTRQRMGGKTHRKAEDGGKTHRKAEDGGKTHRSTTTSTAFGVDTTQ